MNERYFFPSRNFRIESSKSNEEIRRILEDNVKEGFLMGGLGFSDKYFRGEIDKTNFKIRKHNNFRNDITPLIKGNFSSNSIKIDMGLDWTGKLPLIVLLVLSIVFLLEYFFFGFIPDDEKEFLLFVPILYGVLIFIFNIFYVKRLNKDKEFLEKILK